MLFIGDVHAKFEEYDKLRMRHDVTVQVGDFGFGFGRVPKLRPTDYFIRGNHDDPAKARAHRQYLGDWGMTNLGFFVVSGAASIDRAIRTEGRDWWSDEELTYAQLSEAFYDYVKAKPAVVVSHDCPIIAQPVDGMKGKTLTGQALQRMWETHKPELWIHGHHHCHSDRDIEGTRFVCVAKNEGFEI